MRQNGPNLILFIALTAAAAGVFWVGEKYLWPPAPKPEPPPKPLTIQQQVTAAVAGTLVLDAISFEKLPPPPKKPVEAPKPVEVKPSEPRALIALGDDTFFLKVLLTNKGGGVQQVILTKFDDASRLGLEIKDPEGPRRLHLIPGYLRPWKPEVKEEPPLVLLAPNYSTAEFGAKQKPGKLSCAESQLSKTSYVLLHYPSKDDPARMPETPDLTSSDIDKYPSAELAERHWNIASVEQPAGGTWKVVFETVLEAPYFLKLKKTFTLSPKDYDFKLTVDVEPLPGRAKGAGQFRYQICGPIGMPIEGEWYTSTTRTVYTGWTDANDGSHRTVDDPKTIHFKAGSDETKRLGRFRYAATATQFFASAIAIDMPEEAKPWEYVRATREYTPIDADVNREKYEADLSHLYDVTFRTISPLYDLPPGEALHHSYSIYNGPVKVMLLKDLEGDRSVDHAVVDKYLSDYRLDTLTDFHSPNWFGRQSDAVGWAWLLIKASNVMHNLLGFLHRLTGHWGITIVLLTMLVKLCLFIPSRRQQAINAKMQAQIATIKPELEELQAKYKDDFMAMSQEKAKLFKKAGIKHAAQFGGCLLLFLQMPILMGLYYCLQESVFFRLEPFLWMPNLAAPDMIAWWSEKIPLISDPANRFSFLSFLYLGPYFNLLPLGAVALFWVQQKLTMPPPTDEMQEQQQKMMKYMLIFSALFFYKVAAGLCVYFIVSGLWSLAERQLIPKPKVKLPPPGGFGDDSKNPETPPKPQGWLARKREEMMNKMEELQKQAEAQRQIRNEPKQDLSNRSRAERRAAKKKKK